MPPITTVPPLSTNTWVVTCFVSIATPPGTIWPGRSLCTSRRQRRHRGADRGQPVTAIQHAHHHGSQQQGDAEACGEHALEAHIDGFSRHAGNPAGHLLRKVDRQAIWLRFAQYPRQQAVALRTSIVTGRVELEAFASHGLFLHLPFAFVRGVGEGRDVIVGGWIHAATPSRVSSSPRRRSRARNRWLLMVPLARPVMREISGMVKIG